MKPRLLKVYNVEYEPAEYDGDNASGVTPIGDRVLVLCDKVKEQTTGGVFLTDDGRDRHDQSAISGVVVALGDDAFAWNSDRSRPFAGARPKAGDRVYFEKFAGLLVPGDDGNVYRLMDDKCLGAVIS